jgi:uncharacterized protein
MNDLPTEHQPKSEDPDFWNVWTGKDEAGDKVLRPAKWAEVCEQWQNKVSDDVLVEDEADIPF